MRLRIDKRKVLLDSRGLFESVRGLPIVGIQLLVNIRIDESDDDRPRVNVLGRTGRVEFSYARG